MFHVSCREHSHDERILFFLVSTNVRRIYWTRLACLDRIIWALLIKNIQQLVPSLANFGARNLTQWRDFHAWHNKTWYAIFSEQTAIVPDDLSISFNIKIRPLISQLVSFLFSEFVVRAFVKRSNRCTKLWTHLVKFPLQHDGQLLLQAVTKCVLGSLNQGGSLY